MSRNVNFWGQGNKASVSGEERANILLLACCYQEVSTGWLMWTTLTAYDLNEGAIKWSIPLGEVPELAARGIGNTGTHYPKVGPVITAGGNHRTDLGVMSAGVSDTPGGEFRHLAERDGPLDGALVQVVRSKGGPHKPARRDLLVAAGEQEDIRPLFA